MIFSSLSRFYKNLCLWHKNRVMYSIENKQISGYIYIASTESRNWKIFYRSRKQQIDTLTFQRYCNILLVSIQVRVHDVWNDISQTETIHTGQILVELCQPTMLVALYIDKLINCATTIVTWNWNDNPSLVNNNKLCFIVIPLVA